MIDPGSLSATGTAFPGGGAPIHVLALGTQTSRPEGIVAHRTRHLLPRDVAIQLHLPVTSPARTLFDIADTLTISEFEWALDDALARRIVGPPQLKDVIERLANRPGAALLRALLEARRGSGITRSELGRRFLALIRQAGLPSPDRNVPLCGYNVDFLWRPQRLVVEVDAYGTHGSKSAFERDRRKDQALRDAGFTVVRVTRRQLEEEPFRVVAILARMLTTHYTS